MSWEWTDLIGVALAAVGAGLAAYWRREFQRIRRMQFVTAVRLDESRSALKQVVHDLARMSKQLEMSREKANELHELAAAYVIAHQLDELRDNPAPHPTR